MGYHIANLGIGAVILWLLMPLGPIEIALLAIPLAYFMPVVIEME